MPRTYKPDPNTKRYKKYDSEVLQKAVQELLSSKKSLNEVSKKYDIHKSVLYRHSKKEMKTPGGQTALTLDTELQFIEYINKCGEWGYPLDTMDLRYIIKMYLDRLEITHKKFHNNLPGPDYVENFLKRHRNRISQRIAENIKRSRAAVSKEIIEAYHKELIESLEGVPPSNIINYDETNLTDDPGRKKVLVKRGCKYPERVMNHSKASTSIMMAGAADGTLLPPYVVYKATLLYDTWVKNGPEGASYNRSASGWFENTIFEDWVKDIVIPYFSDKPGKKIMIGDNLSSHISIHLIKLCEEQNIHFVFLPPNSTHLTQPLDVAFFRPMKIAWREILLRWKKTDGRNCGSVPKGCFPKLLKLLIENLKPNAKNNILSGFRKTGIYPTNVDELMSRLPQETNTNYEQSKTAIDESVLNYLKEMRFGTMNVTEPKKKKKLNIIAGKSVSFNEIEANNCEAQDTILITPNCKESHEATAVKKTANQKITKKKVNNIKTSLDNEPQPSTSFHLSSTFNCVTKEKQDKGKGKGKGKKTKLPLVDDKQESVKTTMKNKINTESNSKVVLSTATEMDHSLLSSVR